jgi:hypothetical protein
VLRKRSKILPLCKRLLNQSLKVFKATENIAVEYIQLRPTDSVDLVISPKRIGIGQENTHDG